MTAKDYLRRAGELRRDIERKFEQIQHLQAMATRATSSAEALRVSGTPNHSKLEDAAIRKMEACDELAAAINAHTEVYGEIARVIEAVPDPVHRQLLALRYLDGKTWEEIAVKMHFSWQWVHKIHSRALAATQEAIESDTIYVI